MGKPWRSRQHRRPAPPKPGTLTARTVTAQLAVMTAAAAAASVAAFWLSYGGLHAFATRGGLTGAEAWAWPAAVDLFIVAGEAGVALALLSRRSDPVAWAYLAAGIAVSCTGNALRGYPAALAWAPYAVAALPPVAAAAALACLLHAVRALAADRDTNTVNRRVTADPGSGAHTSGPVTRPGPTPQRGVQRRAGGKSRARGADDPAVLSEARNLIIKATATGTRLTDRKLAAALDNSITRYRAKQLLMASNGAGPGEE